MELNVAVIKELAQCLKDTGVGRLNLETKEFKLSLEQQAETATAVPAGAGQAPAENAVAAKPAAQADPPKGNIVKSPLVGTFYNAPSPDKAPFVSVGKKVAKGETLFIIESMKLMNEITSDFDGTVAEISVENGSPVEYGQPIMRIE